MPRANASGVNRLMRYSADRCAGLAPLRARDVSSDYSAAAEDVEHEGLEWGGGVDRDVADAMARAEGLYRSPPFVQALAVESNRVVVQRYGHCGAALTIDEPHIAT